MSEQNPSVPVAIAARRMDPLTRPGHIHLNVASLERQLTFYQQVLGMRLHWRQDHQAGLGAGGEDLVRLSETPNRRRYHGVCGLYHFAILYPNRHELARAVAWLFHLGWQNYPTDHILTKTTYLEDVEGNGIELYCESPEDGVFRLEGNELVARRADGTPSNGREALDLKALFTHLSDEDRLDAAISPQTRLGHFHLHVASLEDSMDFYHQRLGFDHMGLARSFRMGMVSAGGYHHHIGFNTWQGEGAPPAPDEALGLAYISFNLPNSSAWDALLAHLVKTGVEQSVDERGLWVSDPSQNRILFKAVAGA